MKAYFLLLDAEMRRKKWLRQLHQERLQQEVATPQPKLWYKAIWWLGDGLITLGQKLKDNQELILWHQTQEVKLQVNNANLGSD